MLLQENRLRIRNAETDDAGLLCAWWNDGPIMAHAGFPNGLGTTEQKIIELLSSDTDEARRLIIEYDDVPIGEMNYRTKGEKTAQIGIKICDFSHHGKGLGTACLKLLINWLFAERGYRKIILDTNLNNIRAQHVYEKLGFRKVKTNIDSWKNQLGELQSSVEYELSANDWNG